MKRIRFVVQRDSRYGADVSVELCGDLGCGAVDYDRPLPPGRMKLWPVAPAELGHLVCGHVTGRHMDSFGDDGHLDGVHLWDEHLRPALALLIESPRYVFGRFRHGLRMFDGAGNGSAEPVECVHTVNDSPPVPGGLRRVVEGEPGGRLRFVFDPVRFRAMAGG